MGIHFDLSNVGCHMSLASAAVSLSSSIQEISIFPVPYGQGDDFGTLAVDHGDELCPLAGLYVSEYSQHVPRITWWKTSTIVFHGGIYPGNPNELTVHDSELVLYLAGLAFFLAGSFDWDYRSFFEDRSRLSLQPDWSLFDKGYAWTTKATSVYDKQREAKRAAVAKAIAEKGL